MAKRIVYGVLNWGLGHASRSAIFIRKCIQLGHAVTIASDGEALLFLKKEFPQQPFLELPAYNPRYAASKSFFRTMLSQLPQFMNAIRAEKNVLASYIKEHPTDWVISDNRYGLYYQQVCCAIITHQSNILYPGNACIQYLAQQVNKRLLNQFDQIWVPDCANSMLSGALSKTSQHDRVRYIGLLTDVEHLHQPTDIDLCVVLSGPEPQRSLLEKKLMDSLSTYRGNVVFIQGVVSPKKTNQTIDNMQVYNYLSRKEINQILNRAKMVLCRSGYSSLMDLVQLGKKAIIIPTPGQPEQEYLAQRAMEKKWFFSQLQENLHIEKALKEVSVYEPPVVEEEPVSIEALLMNR